MVEVGIDELSVTRCVQIRQTDGYAVVYICSVLSPKVPSRWATLSASLPEFLSSAWLRLALCSGPPLRHCNVLLLWQQ